MYGKPIAELRSVAISDHTCSANCHLTQVNAPIVTPATQATARFTHLEGMED